MPRIIPSVTRQVVGVVFIPAFMMCWLHKWMCLTHHPTPKQPTRKQLEHLDCLEFLIKSGAVDPNAVIQKSKTKTILLVGCLNLASWEYEHLRADYVFSQTSLATL